MTDYLWDKEGEPDPEVERLEAVLRPFAYRGAPPLPPRPPRRRARVMLVSAGLLAVSALVALLIVRPWQPRAGWEIAGQGRLAVGTWLDTGSSRVRLQVANIGTVELGPASRARIVETGATQHRLQLDHGTLSANIDAPPRVFVIETTHARVIDLGCAFELAVDQAGRGQLAVSAGSVALSDGGREVIVPAGATCELTDHGPGTPHFADVPHPRAPERPDPLLPKTAPKEAPKEKAASRPPAQKSAKTRPTLQVAPVRKSEPALKAEPARKADPTRKAEPPVKLNHDALHDLERSAQ